MRSELNTERNNGTVIMPDWLSHFSEFRSRALLCMCSIRELRFTTVGGVDFSDVPTLYFVAFPSLPS